MTLDPVCGVEVDEKKAAQRSQFGGRTYYFCGNECKKEFDQSPEEFVGQEQTGT